LELVWRVIGEGTKLLAQLNQDDRVDLLGPLGHGFTLPENGTSILVGGGLGLPPLVYLYEELRKRDLHAHLLLGVKGRDDIPLADDDPLMGEIHVTAEQDEEFEKGLVTTPAQRLVVEANEEQRLHEISLYSCGPWGLVTALQAGMPVLGMRRAEVSLEQQMGCAMGVCQGCAVRAVGGTTPYRLVCHDGPVFPLFDVEAP
jgi:dihydroorotate dehydrogenase electron transfer subunit